MGKYRYNIDGEFSTRRQWHARNRRKNKRENSIKKLFIIFLLFLILLAAVFCVILFVVRKNEKEDDSFSTSGEIGNVDSSGLEDVPSGSDSSDNQTDDKQPVSDEAADSADKDDDAFSLERTMLSHGNKVVYLTFDDGPSHNTDRILDILNQYCIKATFLLSARPAANMRVYIIGYFRKDIPWECTLIHMTISLFTARLMHLMKISRR